MNYYEELGIGRDAPIEEIRQAYKVLARLLHPDGQPDPRLKAMAECQMKRLNEILAILADSHKRHEYDESLGESPRAAIEWEPPSRPVRPATWYQLATFGLRHWFSVLIGLVVVGVGLWYIEQGAPEAAPVVAKQNQAAADGSTAGGPGPGEPSGMGQPPQPWQYPVKQTSPRGSTNHPEKPRPEVRRAVSGPETPAELNPPEPPRPYPPKEAQPPGLIAAVQPAMPAPQVAKLDPAGPIAKPKEVSFEGSWVYTTESSGKADPNLYPATYVEFTLADEDGSLVGSYRAKYKIPDQAISPDVEFRVQGKSPNGKSCKLAWTSEDGAQGEAELTLRSSNQLNVTWWTTVFGRRAALSSGMAVLTRQQAP